LTVGNQANLVVLDTDSEYEAIRCQSSILYSIRNGEVLVETIPAEVKVNIPTFTK